MQEVYEPYPEIVHEHDLMELFEELSFPEKVRKVIHGLHCPEYTGEYKYARLQLLRLWSVASAVIVPVIMMVLIVAFAKPPIDDKVVYFPITMDPEPKPEKLEPIKKIKEPIKKLDKEIMKLTEPKVSEEIANQAKFSPEPVHKSAVIMIKSPVMMRNIYSNPRVGERGKKLGTGEVSSVTEDAVLRSLRWLKSVQEEDGSWTQKSGGGKGNGTAPAMTGLALLTFLAHGETPGSNEFGLTVEKAMKWLVYNQENDGRFKGRDNHDYSHPIAAYALCEAYCMTKVPTLKEAAEKAINIIINGQHANGGWDYNCKQSARSDTSYMGWCVQALKAAQITSKVTDFHISGLDKALARAVDGFKSNSAASGSFGYTGPQESNLTGVGVLSMQLLGAADDPQCLRGLVWLQKTDLNWEKPLGKNPLYYWYYITQAKFHAGAKNWNAWNEQMKVQIPGKQVILEKAGKDGKDIGYWESCVEAEHCKSRVYNTTLCALMLQVYYRNLGTYFKQPKKKQVDVLAMDDGDIEIDLTRKDG
jgi:hypothetical protein